MANDNRKMFFNGNVVDIRELKMQGSSFSWSSHNEHEFVTCSRSNVQGTRSVSQLSNNPERVYMKCVQCHEFLGWADVMRQNLDAKILSEIQAMRQEFRELKMIVQMIEKGQSIIAMLLIAVIIVQSIVMII